MPLVARTMSKCEAKGCVIKVRRRIICPKCKLKHCGLCGHTHEAKIREWKPIKDNKHGASV